MTEKLDILIVEDNPADAFLISELLNDAGIQVNIRVVNDGQEALDVLNRVQECGTEYEPDIVFLDLNIPKVHGFEVLRQIRTSMANRQLPVVVMTGSRNEDDEQRVRELGGTDYCNKPASAAEIDNITSWLKNKMVVLAGR